MRYGRKDAKGPEECSPDGRLPGAWGLGSANWGSAGRRLLCGRLNGWDNMTSITEKREKRAAVCHWQGRCDGA